MLDDGDLARLIDAIVDGAAAASLESDVLEFKRVPEGRSKEVDRIIADAAICFANGRGGTIVLGVDDELAGEAAFTGTSLEPPYVKRRIYELSRPALLVDVATLDARGVRLLAVHVPESADVHSDTHGRTPQRVNRDCLPLDATAIYRLREDRHGVDHTARASRRGQEAVSDEAIAVARRHLRAYPDRRSPLADLRDSDLLLALGAIDGRGRLTRAGDILLAEPEDGAPPTVVYQYRDTPGGEPRAIERLRRPALVAYDRTLELIAARRTMTPVALTGGVQIELADFPEPAVEEAIANAIVHRDYHVTQPIHVDHSPQVLQVMSPGPLVAGVTPQNILTHPSKPRNARLATAAHALRLAEEVGQGIDRMFRVMIASGRELPQIATQYDAVTVTFVGGAPNRRIASFVAEHLPEAERVDVDTLLVLLTLCRRRTIDALRAADVTQKRTDAAEATLRRLAADDLALIEATRGTVRRTHPTYRLRASALRALGTAVAYNRRTEDEIDRKVIAHVREYGKITNQTARNLFDVDVQRAKAILVDLVARRLLVKAGSGRRGPGVEYHAGPAFPTRRRRVSERRAGPPDQEPLL